MLVLVLFVFVLTVTLVLAVFLKRKQKLTLKEIMCWMSLRVVFESWSKNSVYCAEELAARGQDKAGLPERQLFGLAVKI